MVWDFLTRNFPRLYQPFCQQLLGQQRSASRSSKSLEAKCKRIGAVITRRDEQQKGPIVALLGWNSAQDKHLAKYSEIFENKGFDTIRISANPFNTFLLLKNVKKISLLLLDILEEMDSGQKRPFVFFAFSMGGFNSLFFINEAILTPGQVHFNSISVMGTIFDSCPHFPGFHSISGVQSTIMDTIKNPLLKVTIWVGLALVCPTVFLLSQDIKRLIPESMVAPARSPELFLFCRTDPLVDDRNVEIFIEARKKRGVTVFSKCWEESGHVQHYMNYPGEYLREVNTFIDYCMLQYTRQDKHFSQPIKSKL